MATTTVRSGTHCQSLPYTHNTLPPSCAGRQKICGHSWVRRTCRMAWAVGRSRRLVPCASARIHTLYATALTTSPHLTRPTHPVDNIHADNGMRRRRSPAASHRRTPSGASSVPSRLAHLTPRRASASHRQSGPCVLRLSAAPVAHVVYTGSRSTPPTPTPLLHPCEIPANASHVGRTTVVRAQPPERLPAPSGQRSM